MAKQNPSCSQIACEKIVYSLEELIQALFLEGLTKIIIWDQVLENIKYSVVDEPYAVVNLYQKLKNSLIGFMEDINMNELSQFKILELKNMDLPLQRLLDYFSSQIKESFTENSIDIKYVKSFKNLITNAMKTLYNSGSDNDDEKSSTDDELDDIEKGFNTLIKTTTKKLHQQYLNNLFMSLVTVFVNQ